MPDQKKKSPRLTISERAELAAKLRRQAKDHAAYEEFLSACTNYRYTAGRIRRCLQRLLGCRDHVHRMAGKADIAGLGGFQRTGLQRCVHGGGNVDAVARQDVQRVSAGAGVGDRGAAGDHGRVVPRHIADGQRDDARRRAGCRPRAPAGTASSSGSPPR